MNIAAKYLQCCIAGLAVMLLLAPFAYAFEVGGLATPDSFIVDEATGSYYISNIKGRPLVRGNVGFITRLDPSGDIEKLKFIEGGRDGVTLHAPKGLLILGNTLYAADIDHVRGFDKQTGAPTVDIDLSTLKVKYLNDVAAGPDGKIFTSDTVGNTVYSIDPANGNKVTAFASGKSLDSPTGLVYSKKLNKLYVTLGRGMLGMLDMDGKLEIIATLPSRGLVGIDLDEDGNVFISSFGGSVVYRIAATGKAKVLARVGSAPADISLDKKKRLVLVPLFLRHKAVTVPY